MPIQFAVSVAKFQVAYLGIFWSSAQLGLDDFDNIKLADQVH